MPVTLKLYTRAGCHLCDEMLKELEAFRHARAEFFSIELEDIDRDPETQRVYCLRVPVLTAGESGEVLCEASFNRQAVQDYLAAYTG